MVNNRNKRTPIKPTSPRSSGYGEDLFGVTMDLSNWHYQDWSYGEQAAGVMTQGSGTTPDGTPYISVETCCWDGIECTAAWVSGGCASYQGNQQYHLGSSDNTLIMSPLIHNNDLQIGQNYIVSAIYKAEETVEVSLSANDSDIDFRTVYNTSDLNQNITEMGDGWKYGEATFYFEPLLGGCDGNGVDINGEGVDIGTNCKTNSECGSGGVCNNPTPTTAEYTGWAIYLRDGSNPPGSTILWTDPTIRLADTTLGETGQQFTYELAGGNNFISFPFQMDNNSVADFILNNNINYITYQSSGLFNTNGNISGNYNTFTPQDGMYVNVMAGGITVEVFGTPLPQLTYDLTSSGAGNYQISYDGVDNMNTIQALGEWENQVVFITGDGVGLFNSGVGTGVSDWSGNLSTLKFGEGYWINLNVSGGISNFQWNRTMMTTSTTSTTLPDRDVKNKIKQLGLDVEVTQQTPIIPGDSIRDIDPG